MAAEPKPQNLTYRKEAKEMTYFNLEVLKEGRISAEKDEKKRTVVRRQIAQAEQLARKRNLIERHGPREIIDLNAWDKILKELKLNAEGNN